eukprot:3515307-Prymnesium_polylepis.1
MTCCSFSQASSRSFLAAAPPSTATWILSGRSPRAWSANASGGSEGGGDGGGDESGGDGGAE